MSGSVELSGAIKDAIGQMQAAFDEAIAANAKITEVKTEKGAEETAAQQRPNIG